MNSEKIWACKMALTSAQVTNMAKYKIILNLKLLNQITLKILMSNKAMINCLHRYKKYHRIRIKLKSKQLVLFLNMETSSIFKRKESMLKGTLLS